MSGTEETSEKQGSDFWGRLRRKVFTKEPVDQGSSEAVKDHISSQGNNYGKLPDESGEIKPASELEGHENKSLEAAEHLVDIVHHELSSGVSRDEEINGEAVDTCKGTRNLVSSATRPADSDQSLGSLSYQQEPLNSDNNSKITQEASHSDANQTDLLSTKQANGQTLGKGPQLNLSRADPGIPSDSCNGSHKTETSTLNASRFNEEVNRPSWPSDDTFPLPSSSTSSSSSSPISNSSRPSSTLQHQINNSSGSLLARGSSIKMSLTSRLSQLRHRHSKEPTQPPANPDTTSSSGSDPLSTRTRSVGSLDDWTDISSMDAVSMGSLSQPEPAGCSKDDGTTKVSQVKSKTKSSLEAPSSDHVPLAVDTDAVLKKIPRPSSGSEEWDKDQRKVYEQQLENLQEQLVDIMIENQTLAQKLQRYENSDVIPLLKKLEEETERNETLTQRCCVLEKRLKNNRMPTSRTASADEVGLDATELVSSSSDEFDGPPPGLMERLQNYVMDSVYNIIGDFTEEGEETDAEETKSEGDELTVKRLKENLRRFKSACDPCVSFFKAVSALISWKSSSTTFLVFLFYMYAVWKGWILTVVLGMMIWYLTSTYFISIGWTIEFSLLPYHLIEVTPDEGPPLSMSDRFQLVLHVCRKVQNLLSYLADILEKMCNFLYWTNPDLTKKIYIDLVIAFVASLFLNGSTLVSLAGLYLGVKVFLMNPLLERYPRLKEKYSTARKILREIPTNAELEQRRAIEETEQFLIPDIEGVTIRLASHESPDAKPASKRWKTFSQSFNLPHSEQPLPGWEDGKRCTMITKRTVKGAFRNGRLYLTKSFLCFEKSRLLKEGDMIIPLKDVTKIDKAKPFAFFPGSGMSIEIHLLGLDQPILFGGILYRNTVHEKVTRVWEAAQMAIQLQSNQQTGVEREGTSGGGGATLEERREQREEGAEGGGVEISGGRGGGGGGRKEKQDIKNEEEEEVLDESIMELAGRHPDWATC